VYKGSAIDSSQTFTVIPTTDELDVENIQNVLLSDFTATWCGPCGQWGKATIIEAANKYGSRGVKVSFNSSQNNDVLYVRDAAIYADYVNLSAYPTQAVNLKIVDQVFPASTTELIKKVTDMADVEAAKAPTAVVGLACTENGFGSYTIRTRTRFITDMPSGKYNVAVFIIQDNIVEAQNGNSQTYQHTGVFRKTASDNTGANSVWGTEIALQPKANDKIEKTFTVQVPLVTGKLAWVKANMKAVAVIYKMNETNNKPEMVVNCNMVKAE
jgi:hypothetical protein